VIVSTLSTTYAPALAHIEGIAMTEPDEIELELPSVGRLEALINWSDPESEDYRNPALQITDNEVKILVLLCVAAYRATAEEE
jgi:hypothetical protein